MRQSKSIIILTFLVVFFFFSGCNLPSLNQYSQDEISAALTEVNSEYRTSAPISIEPIVETDLAPTETPEKVLTVCLGNEPSSLFFYADSSQAAWSALESIYDGPFDIINGKAEPVIFTDIQITTEPVQAKKKDIAVDYGGNIIALGMNAEYVPAQKPEKCADSLCPAQWKPDQTEAEMLQYVIRFSLRDDLKWSDGQPLTAHDSVYSYELNKNRLIAASKAMTNYTQSYIALDDKTVEWRGIPGFVPHVAQTAFWNPLPRHMMESMSVEEILSDTNINQTPIGWGAYKIASWEKGKQITAVKNPAYNQISGSVYFDKVIYKFIGKPGDNGIAALENGTCDIIDSSVDLVSDIEPVLEDTRDGKYALYIQPKETWEQVSFAFSSKIEGRSAGYTDYFTSPAVRKAILQCIDRKAIIRQTFYGQAEIAEGFYPAGHSLFSESIIDYNPDAAKIALSEAGWVLPADGSGILKAEKVQGVLYGNPFSIELLTSNSEKRMRIAELIRQNLADCGIEAVIKAEPITSFYAAAPDGNLFSRKFDLALFSWSTGLEPPCALFMAENIPTQENQWVGLNTGAFSSKTFDEVCKKTSNQSLLLPEGQNALVEIQKSFQEELPAIPLFFNFSAAASSNKICGVRNTIGARSILWNIESLSSADENCAVSEWHNIYN